MIQMWAQNNRLVQTTTPAFAPTDIAGLQLWLDANDVASLTLDGSNNVSQWSDKSGNAKHATQATVNRRPSYTLSTINGLASITFDGTDDRLAGSVSLLAGDTDFTMFGVVQKLANSGDPAVSCAYFIIGLDKSFGISVGSFPTGAADGLLNGGVAWSAGSAIANGAIQYQTMYRTGGSCYYTRNGANALTYTGNPVAAPYGNYQIGGHDGASGSRQNIRVAELLFYSSALSAGNIATVESYLATKWGL